MRVKPPPAAPSTSPAHSQGRNLGESPLAGPNPCPDALTRSEVADIVFGRFGGGDLIMIALKCYLDETERPQGELIGVAGCLFTRRGATKFVYRWNRLFSPYGGCHMTDLSNGTGQFKGIGEADKKDLVKQATQVLTSTVTAAAFVACSLCDIRRIGGAEAEWRGYAICCQLAALGLADWCTEHMPLNNISYLFESGHEYEAKGAELFRALMADPEARREYRIAEHAYASAEDTIWLQAADFFAWEIGKYLVERESPKPRPPRKSLQSLVSTLRNQRLPVMVITAPQLEWYFKVQGWKGVLRPGDRKDGLGESR